MRKILMLSTALFLGAAGGAQAGGLQGAGVERQRQDASAVISNWPDTSRKAAQAIIDKYGQPDVVSTELLIWNDSGPWKRTVAFREGVDHHFPMKHKDSVKQTINYRVPVDKIDDLTAFDGSVYVDRTKGELGAKCDKEAANFLALNLANEIVTGRRTVEEARQFYAETIASMMAGKESEYLQKLLFGVKRMGTADPDKVLLKEGGR